MGPARNDEIKMSMSFVLASSATFRVAGGPPMTEGLRTKVCAAPYLIS